MNKTQIFSFLTFKKIAIKVSVHLIIPICCSLALSTDLRAQEKNAELPIYKVIEEELQKEYQKIGDREAQALLRDNPLAIVGGLNSVGISYHRPFIDFSYSVDRKLAPDLFDDQRWIVTDTMSLSIDASKLFGRLKNEGKIDISEKNLNAFVGVVFKRSFTYNHIANSYEDGLMKDFEKLFFPHRYFDSEKVLELDPNDYLVREDSLSFHVGGVATIPLTEGASFYGGYLSRYEKLAKTECFVTNEYMPVLHLSHELSETNSQKFQMGLQAEFLKILKMTLFKYDLEYLGQKKKKLYLDFVGEDFYAMKDDPLKILEFERILQAKSVNITHLLPYVVTEESRESTSMTSKYQFLTRGGVKEAKTEQVQIVAGGILKKFFKHVFVQTTYADSLLSKLVGGIIFKLFDQEIGSQKNREELKKVTVEYEGERDKMLAKEDMDIENNDLLSLKMETEVRVKKTSGKLHQFDKNRMAFYIERFSGANPTLAQMVDNEILVGPMALEGKFHIQKNGIKHLNNIPFQEAFSLITGVCEEHPKTSFVDWRNFLHSCEIQMENNYLKYYKDLHHEKYSADMVDECKKKSLKYWFSFSKKRKYLTQCLSGVSKRQSEKLSLIPLYSLRYFLDDLQSKSYSKVDFYNFFGVDNIFFYGSLKAYQHTGEEILTHFNQGKFRSTGAIDHYMRQTNLRAPASVIVD